MKAQLYALLGRAIVNPKSTIAGLAAIAGVCWPHYTGQIAAVAAGLGLILSADAK